MTKLSRASLVLLFAASASMGTLGCDPAQTVTSPSKTGGATGQGGGGKGDGGGSPGPGAGEDRRC